MNGHKKFTIMLLSFILILAFIISSCDFKFIGVKAVIEGQNTRFDNTTNNLDNLESPSTIREPVEPAPKASSRLKNEISGLNFILASYLDSNHSLFVGEENKNYLQNFLFNSEETQEALPVSDWEKVVRILFSFGEEDDSNIKTYISDFDSEGKIERQHAVSGLMKLLSIRYPLSLGKNYESVKKSEIITDFDEISDKYQILVRQAYCLGFIDFTVDAERLFRPSDPLNQGEAISMLYRILTNFGLPVLEPAGSTFSKAAPKMQSYSAPVSAQSIEALSIETIKQEYMTYLNSLNELTSSNGKKRSNLLVQAESIMEINFDNESINAPLSLEQWKQIFQELFGFELEQIDSYLSYETGGTLPYDIAAISIFELFDQNNGSKIRDAVTEDLEKARMAIPQFDTARDANKFAQMFSSGLLDGLYQIPGFTPKRPVNKAEAILLVKRIVEDMAIK